MRERKITMPEEELKNTAQTTSEEAGAADDNKPSASDSLGAFLDKLEQTPACQISYYLNKGTKLYTSIETMLDSMNFPTSLTEQITYPEYLFMMSYVMSHIQGSVKEGQELIDLQSIFLWACTNELLENAKNEPILQQLLSLNYGELRKNSYSRYFQYFPEHMARMEELDKLVVDGAFPEDADISPQDRRDYAMRKSMNMETPFTFQEITIQLRKKISRPWSPHLPLSEYQDFMRNAYVEVFQCVFLVLFYSLCGTINMAQLREKYPTKEE